MRVLLLDDNAELRDFLVAVLIENGVDAEGVATAEQAIEKFNQERFDGFVVDTTMGESDAVGLANQVRATKQGKGVPVLLMSEITTSLARRIAQASNCQFIAKPFGLAEFVDSVRDLR